MSTGESFNINKDYGITIEYYLLFHHCSDFTSSRLECCLNFDSVFCLRIISLKLCHAKSSPHLFFLKFLHDQVTHRLSLQGLHLGWRNEKGSYVIKRPAILDRVALLHQGQKSHLIAIQKKKVMSTMVRCYVVITSSILVRHFSEADERRFLRTVTC